LEKIFREKKEFIVIIFIILATLYVDLLGGIVVGLILHFIFNHEKSTKKLNVIYSIILAIILFNFECFAQNPESKSSISKNINIQSLTTLSSTKGHAFGESTHRQIINHLSEIPISNLNSFGVLTQLSRVDSTYKNNTEAYSFNGLEFFHRYRFASTKFINFIVHNSYRFHGIYNENNIYRKCPNKTIMS